MILIPLEYIEIITASASNIDVGCSFSNIDLYLTNNTTTQNTKITTATTTTIISAPATGTVNRVGYINIKNVSGTTNTITIRKNDSVTNYVIAKTFTLLVGEVIVYSARDGWYQLDVNGVVYPTTIARSYIARTVTMTDADVIAQAGTLYDLPPSVITVDRLIVLDQLTEEGDVIQISHRGNDNPLLSFAGGTVYNAYDEEVPVLLAKGLSEIRLIRGVFRIYLK
jgi:hypothetical protein